jgi:hypothetical protein
MCATAYHKLQKLAAEFDDAEESQDGSEDRLSIPPAR